MQLERNENGWNDKLPVKSVENSFCGSFICICRRFGRCPRLPAESDKLNGPFRFSETQIIEICCDCRKKTVAVGIPLRPAKWIGRVFFLCGITCSRFEVRLASAVAVSHCCDQLDWDSGSVNGDRSARASPDHRHLT